MGKAEEYRDMSIDEVEALCADARKELFALVSEIKRTKKVKESHLIKQTKKNIARLLTVLTEKQSKDQHQTA